MYEKEHEKFERDRERMKAEAFETKKRADETASVCVFDVSLNRSKLNLETASLAMQ
jgi:hypothetical protein